MLLRSQLFFIAIFLFVQGIAQETYYDFTAYGHLPKVVDNGLFKALDSAKSKEIRVRYLDTIAQIYLRSGHSDSLMYYGEQLKSEMFYSEIGLPNAENITLKAMYYQGVAAQKMGLLDEAINAYIQGLEAFGPSYSMHKYLKLQLAETYLYKGELEKGKDLLEELPQNTTDHHFSLKNAVVKSYFLILEKEYMLAKAMITKALNSSYTDNYKKLKLELLLNLSEIQLRQQDFETLIKGSDDIKKEALNEGYYDLYIEASINLGYGYAMLKNYEVSEVALSSAYINTIQWNRLELQQKVINALVKLYNAKEDYKNAYSLMTQYQSVTREIAAKQNQRLIKELELKYDTLKKEQEIDKLQEDQLLQAAEIERQKTIKYAFLIGFMVILVPIILLLVVYYQKLQAQSLLNQQQEAINQQELKNVLQSQELDLAKNTITVQSKERDRIARELHDSIGGNLAGIKLKMNSLADDKPEFKQILSQLDATYDQVREISHSLIPKSFETSAFTGLVESYIEDISTELSFDIRFEAFPKETVNTIDVPLQVALFNIIKELLTNAIKHAKAQDISLQLTALTQENSIELIYEDDGVGFDLNTLNKGIGIYNIEKRVGEFNGTFSIDSAKNRGTVISISLPQK